ncbi:MAG TPA: hypothetical protein VGL54_05090 [Solirubrobacteraceae bacterium]
MGDRSIRLVDVPDRSIRLADVPISKAWAKFLWRAFPFWAFYVLALRRRTDRARKRDARQLEETGESVARIVLETKAGSQTLRRLTYILTVATVIITIATVVNVVVAILK